jgi:hypothetical protein
MNVELPLLILAIISGITWIAWEMVRKHLKTKDTFDVRVRLPDGNWTMARLKKSNTRLENDYALQDALEAARMTAAPPSAQTSEEAGGYYRA